MQYKPIEICHVENAALGKDFNLCTTGSFFHAFTHGKSNLNLVQKIYMQSLKNSMLTHPIWAKQKVIPMTSNEHGISKKKKRRDETKNTMFLEVL